MIMNYVQFSSWILPKWYFPGTKELRKSPVFLFIQSLSINCKLKFILGANCGLLITSVYSFFPNGWIGVTWTARHSADSNSCSRACFAICISHRESNQRVSERNGQSSSILSRTLRVLDSGGSVLSLRFWLVSLLRISCFLHRGWPYERACSCTSPLQLQVPAMLANRGRVMRGGRKKMSERRAVTTRKWRI